MADGRAAQTAVRHSSYRSATSSRDAPERVAVPVEPFQPEAFGPQRRAAPVFDALRLADQGGMPIAFGTDLLGATAVIQAGQVRRA
ncbi:hypothetical protein NUM_34400 [Actinocatenispora comari]|uniref:Uncharacterized protein n=1 Tax=Actinocatenispora comari TaxID=2807577 RepID=A0A8J4ABB8_9ACTN|nr:hypothetical protein NUM_34400 [Actinocatenispora comari]